MRIAHPSAAAFALLALAGCALAQREQQDSPRLQAAGHALTRAACAGCHAVEAAGESPAPEAPALRLLAAQGYRVATLEEALHQGISTGHPAMPIMRYSDSDVRAIVAYLRAIQTEK